MSETSSLLSIYTRKWKLIYYYAKVVPEERIKVHQKQGWEERSHDVLYLGKINLFFTPKKIIYQSLISDISHLLSMAKRYAFKIFSCHDLKEKERNTLFCKSHNNHAKQGGAFIKWTNLPICEFGNVPKASLPTFSKSRRFYNTSLQAIQNPQKMRRHMKLHFVKLNE